MTIVGTAVVAAVIGGCQAPMSTLAPVSDAAARIASLTWFMLVLSAVVFLIVLGMLVAAILRNRRRDPLAVDFTPKSKMAVILGGAAFPAVILTAIFIISLGAMGRFPSNAPAVAAFTITGEQWWWRIRYDDTARAAPATPTAPVAFANELHVPVGQAVYLTLGSADVIHSFWVPRIQGKIDVIPGSRTELHMVVTQPGTYRGQCAEYCGVQHGNMAFTVVAESPERFRAWLAAQRAPAHLPASTDSVAAVGRGLFERGTCAACHAIRGTTAHGGFGPDLTHVGSRRTLAAGVVPNTLGSLAGWIANAQSIKPGCRMPSTREFDGQQLLAVARYLESLK
jgi:cytochrome c oxidase subunit 2